MNSCAENRRTCFNVVFLQDHIESHASSISEARRHDWKALQNLRSVSLATLYYFTCTLAEGVIRFRRMIGEEQE